MLNPARRKTAEETYLAGMGRAKQRAPLTCQERYLAGLPGEGMPGLAAAETSGGAEAQAGA